MEIFATLATCKEEISGGAFYSINVDKKDHQYFPEKDFRHTFKNVYLHRNGNICKKWILNPNNFCVMVKYLTNNPVSNYQDLIYALKLIDTLA